MNWKLVAELYAANSNLSLDDIARMTGRTRSTVKTHHESECWAKQRREAQERIKLRARATLEEDAVEFATFRQRMMFRIARRSLTALARNLKAPGGEHGHGSDKVDAYQLQATLKTLDDGTLAGKVAEQLTPILFETVSREATDELMRQKIESFRASPHLHAGKNGTTSTPKPRSGDALVASRFSPRNGTS